MKSEFEFTLVLSGMTDFTDDQIDALCEAGCDDATAAQRQGRVYLTFSRLADSWLEALLSAIADVNQSAIGASVLRVDSSSLVSQAEIARRTDRSRQSIGQYITGQRGPGDFPSPASNVQEGQPMWHWCEVSYWLFQNELIAADQHLKAQQLAAINSILELEHLIQIAPAVTTPLLNDARLWSASAIRTVEA